MEGVTGVTFPLKSNVRIFKFHWLQHGLSLSSSQSDQREPYIFLVSVVGTGIISRDLRLAIMLSDRCHK